MNQKQSDIIKFAYNLLTGIDELKFSSIDENGYAVFYNKNNEKIEINLKNSKEKQSGGNTLPEYSETSEMVQLGGIVSEYSETSEKGQIGGIGGTGGIVSKYSETSEMGQLGEMSLKYSETSEMTYMPNISNKMIGGSKNIFKKINYSETSSIKKSIVSNYSKTSPEIFNERNDNYSETSVVSQIGGKNNQTTDTLMGISEIKQRKSFKSTNLDMGIFKKNQISNLSDGSLGGLIGGLADQNIKKKMADIGINSNSSTSSICE
jgi:hypothetical protein